MDMGIAGVTSEVVICPEVDGTASEAKVDV